MKIALIGYGKMGKEIEKVAVARGHEIVSIIDVDNQDDFNSFTSSPCLSIHPVLPDTNLTPAAKVFI